MFWTIVAPEILPAWALNQRLAAMTIRDLYNKEKGVLSYLSQSMRSRSKVRLQEGVLWDLEDREGMVFVV